MAFNRQSFRLYVSLSEGGEEYQDKNKEPLRNGSGKKCKQQIFRSFLGAHLIFNDFVFLLIAWVTILPQGCIAPQSGDFLPEYK